MTNQELIARRNKTLGPTYQSFFDEPLHLVRGSGTSLWDVDGREYLDCYNNVVSVGHCHPHVVEALCNQAATLNTHTRYLHEGIVELGEMLVERLPGDLDTCIFNSTGSEANDLAVQIARHVTGQQGVLVTEASYHGVSELTRRLSTDSYPAEDRPEWLAVVEPPNLYRGPYRRDDPEAGQHYLELARQPAAALIDLVWDSNGPLVVPPDYLLGLAAEVRKRGGLVIPLALMATRRDIIDDYARKYHYFSTFSGNPVSAAVGKAVIEVIENEGLLQNAHDTGAYLEAGLRELATRHEVIGDVQGCGLFWGLDLVSDRVTREPLSPQHLRHLGSLIAQQGVITGTSGRYGQILKLRPPLPFSRSDADRALAAIDATLPQLQI
jgi:4-aminobutyrate aminotransferase-like enzyme